MTGNHDVRRHAFAITVRMVRPGDLPAVIALDVANTGVAKPSYWQDMFERHAVGDGPLVFLIAEGEDGWFLGFILGEVRAWEFGSEPCGWIFAIGVMPEARQAGVGARLLAELGERFRTSGVHKLRTMLARDNHLIMSFFRSQGMMAGPFIQLEKDLD